MLSSWRAEAPPRLERTGRQKELERWCLNKFLSKRSPKNPIKFPLSVYEGENPDFVLEEENSKYGIEVTEAVCPDEQAMWTDQAKTSRRSDEKPVVWRIPQENSSGERYLGLVREILKKKNEKCSSGCHQLLIYLNTHDDWFVEPNQKLETLSQIPLEDIQFEKIWLLANECLFELVNKELIFRAIDDWS